MQKIINWKDIKEYPIPLKKEPIKVFVKTKEEIGGIDIHTGIFAKNMPSGIFGGRFGFDMPEITHWAEIEE